MTRKSGKQVTTRCLAASQNDAVSLGQCAGQQGDSAKAAGIGGLGKKLIETER